MEKKIIIIGIPSVSQVELIAKYGLDNVLFVNDEESAKQIIYDEISEPVAEIKLRYIEPPSFSLQSIDHNIYAAIERHTYIDGTRKQISRYKRKK